MENTVNLIANSKNNYDISLNHKTLKELNINPNEKLYLLVFIDNNYNKHLILANKPFKTKKIIYQYWQKLSKKNKLSKSYRFRLNYVISSLFDINYKTAYFKEFKFNNKCYYELIFNMD